MYGELFGPEDAFTCICFEYWKNKFCPKLLSTHSPTKMRAVVTYNTALSMRSIAILGQKVVTEDVPRLMQKRRKMMRAVQANV
jgi:hypothetical protein